MNVCAINLHYVTQGLIYYTSIYQSKWWTSHEDPSPTLPFNPLCDYLQTFSSNSMTHKILFYIDSLNEIFESLKNYAKMF
jgi:hypothetical protein